MKIFHKLRSRAGFTMVELLVIISIIGILSAAVLAALNPAEQLRKGRDTARKADAATLLNALDRYQATFGCYPWERDAATNTCDEATNDIATTAVADTDFAAGGDLEALVTTDELKTQFSTRNSIAQSELKMVESGGQASVCFSPESQTARDAGLGPIMNDDNTASAAANCDADYTVDEADCNVCLPQ